MEIPSVTSEALALLVDKEKSKESSLNFTGDDVLDNIPYELIEHDKNIIESSRGEINIAAATDAGAIEMSNNCERNSYKGIAFVSVLLYPLFSYFLFMAISAALEDAREKYELNESWGIFFKIFAVFLSVVDACTGVTVVNPIERAASMLKSKDVEKKDENLDKNRCAKIFRFFNHAVVNSVNTVVSGADIVSISYLTSITGVVWGFGTPISILGIIYLNMLLKSKIDEHSLEYVKRLTDTQSSMVVSAIKSPIKSLEMIILVIVNAGNRSVSRAYMMNQILQKLFFINYGNTMFGFVCYAASSTFYTCLVTRTLNVHKQLFNKQFDEINVDFLKKVKLSRCGVGVDILMTTVRAGAVSVLIFRHGPDRLPDKLAASIIPSFLIFVHNLYVRIKSRQCQVALDEQLKQIASNNIVTYQQNSDWEPEKIFDLIKERYKSNEKLKSAATFLNVGSRAASWFSFIGFLVILEKLIRPSVDLKLDFYDLICIQQLLSNPSLENDASFFQENLIENLSYYVTKINLERRERHFGLQAFWRAKKDYPKLYLNSFLAIKPEIMSDSLAEEPDGNPKTLTPLYESKKQKKPSAENQVMKKSGLEF